jgi:uncharacterized UBP type Zn finger protein
MLNTDQVDQLSHVKMSSPFTTDQIRQVCEFTFVSDKDAMILLKKNHGDVQRAVEAYFNDPDGSVKEDVI